MVAMTTAQTTTIDKKLHAKLVKCSADWLRTQHGVPDVLTEAKGHRKGEGIEIPDVYGLRNTYSCVIECKVSVADFRADLKKPARIGHDNNGNRVLGIGQHRFYCVPEHLIESYDIEEGSCIERWGLLFWTPEGIRQEKPPMNWRHYERDLMEELALASFGMAKSRQHGGDPEKRRNGSSRGGSTLSMPEHVQAQVRAFLADGVAKASLVVKNVPAVAKCAPSGMKAETYLHKVTEQCAVAGFGITTISGARHLVLEDSNS